jgi:hypothetical protein
MEDTKSTDATNAEQKKSIHGFSIKTKLQQEKQHQRHHHCYLHHEAGAL